MPEVFVGRQEIYDRDNQVAAYELLYRNSVENRATPGDGDLATCQLLCNALTEIGLDQLVGTDRLAYINFTRSFLTGEVELPASPARVVVEVLETVDVDDALVQGLRNLKKAGYRIALDDYIPGSRHEVLLDIADIVKVDVREVSHSQLESLSVDLKRRKLTLLAEKVETLEEHDFCRDLGFDLFQGYYLSRPRIVTGQRISANRLIVLQTLARLQDPDIEFHELEQLIGQDLGLSAKLLQCISSSAFGLRSKVNSIRQAIALLGLQRLRAMVTLVLLGGLDNQADSLVSRAQIRAKMCELLGRELGHPDLRSFFLVGLLSALDTLIAMPLAEIVQNLSLSDELKGALVSHDGILGEALRCTLAYEQADWERVQLASLSALQIRETYLKAVKSAVEDEALLQELRSKRGGPGGSVT